MNNLTTFENFLSEELFIELKNYIQFAKEDDQLGMHAFTTSSTTWQMDNLQSSVPVVRFILTYHNKELHKKITKELKEKMGVYGDFIVIHLWPPLSYLPWHHDNYVTNAITLFLNDEWKDDWGGYFMYEDLDDNKTIKCLKPKRKLAVLQGKGLNHSVSTINIGADWRLTMQIFVTPKQPLI